MHCSDAELISYLDGELSAVSRFRVKRHLHSCWNCRARLSDVEAKIVSLSAAMDRWSFPDPWWRVDAKLRLQEGIEKLEETLVPPLGSTPRIRIGYRFGTAVAAAALILAGLLWHLNSPASLNAIETVARVSEAEDRFNSNVVQQDLDVEIRELKPTPQSRGSRLRVISDSRNGRFVSRWTDAQGVLKHAIWKPSDRAEHIYNASALTTRTPKSRDAAALTALAKDGLDGRQLELAFLRWLEDRTWRPVSFASDLSAWSKEDGTTMTAERIRQRDGSMAIRIAARRSTRRLTAVLTIDVDSTDYRPRLQTIRFEASDRTIEIQLATSRVVTVPPSEMTDAVFQPDSVLLARAKVEAVPPATAETHVPHDPVKIVPPEAASSEAELRAVEAQYVLHRARTCLEEPVQILEENGRVRVRSRTQDAAGESDVETTVATLHDVLDALARFRNREAIPADAPQLTRANRTSSTVLQHAAALRHLAELFSAKRVATFPPEARKLFQVMVMDHAAAIQHEIDLLNLQYKAAEKRPYTVRGWRESASTLYDKLRLLDELVADDRAADAGMLGPEVEGELAVILSDFARERDSAGRRLSPNSH